MDNRARLQHNGLPPIVVFYERNSGLLFICYPCRTNGLYDHIANEYVNEDLGSRVRGPSMKRLNKVLLDLEGIRFFNIGMRKSVLGDNSEDTAQLRARMLTKLSIRAPVVPSDEDIGMGRRFLAGRASRLD